MMEPENGRTHEPSLRELTVELDGLRTLMNERDKWYGDRDKDRQQAVDKALAAVEKQTASAFEAAKEANATALVSQKESAQKTEDSQRQYNTNHNDLIRKMDDQNKATMPRIETESRLFSFEEKLSAVKLDVAAMLAGGKGMEKMWGWVAAAIFLIIAVAGFLHK